MCVDACDNSCPESRWPTSLALLLEIAAVVVSGLPISERYCMIESEDQCPTLYVSRFASFHWIIAVFDCSSVPLAVATL